MKSKKSELFQTGFYIFIFLMVILLFYRFTVQNSDRIQDQNRNYAADAARQTARGIADKFDDSLNLIRLYAHFVSYSLTGPEVSISMLREMEETSPFDAVRFSDVAGVNHAANGKISTIIDRDFFQRGILGETGISVSFHSSIFHQTSLGFFTPLRYEGKIVGVLRGTYLADSYLRGMLKTSYFGHDADVFLCMPDGRIIANSTETQYSGSIFDVLVKAGLANQKIAGEVREIFEDKREGSIASDGTVLAANICVTSVPGYEYVLVQTFPLVVSESMISHANMAGIELEICLVILAVLVAIWLVARAHFQKKGLEKENRQFSTVVRGMSTVFSYQYCEVDLNAKKYAYLSDQNKFCSHDMEATGEYDDLLAHLAKPLANEEIRKSFLDFFASENLKRAFGDKDYVTFECQVSRNGEICWENLVASVVERQDGLISRVLFLRQDVTEMKRRELEAKKRIAIMDRKERQYRLALISNALFSYEFNVSADTVACENDKDLASLRDFFRGSETIDGTIRATDIFAAIGKNVLAESGDEFARTANMDYLRQKFEAGHQEVDLDYWHRDQDGREICVRQAFYLAKEDVTGDILAMTVARDITAQVEKSRMQTRALQDALMQAKHANEAKTTFLSNMSHDIRTPMNAVIGFATIAASHLDNREQVRDCLQKVLSSSNHLLCLINDILDMSRIESGKMQLKEQDCNISELMHNIVNIIQPQVKAKRLRLFIDTFDVLNEDVIADPLKLNQVFINILGNAVKYTPSGGTISFSITQKPAFRHGYADYIFTIRDNGIGMSPDFVRHIFEPFTREATTTRSGIQGTGLGMAITKNIVDMMNGKIEVASEQGKGSCFTLSFTLKVEDSRKKTEDLQTLSGLRVLVVDDDMHVCDSVDKMLKKIGFRSEWTTSGREAVYRAESACSEGDPYNTFIIDWQMPEMNGVETTRRIREKVGNDAPIIILTAYEWADIEDEAKAAGVTAFCAKPLFISDLKYAMLSTHKMLKENNEPEKADVECFRGKRVLLVDDLEMNREVAEFMLTENGFLVETAPDGTDAVDMVKKSPEYYYDTILMDVQMPTMNGYEATRTIRDLSRDDVKTMPIIAMTANALEDDKMAALKSGMNAHIAKPIDCKNFFEVLRKFFSN